MGILGPVLSLEIFIRFNPVASFWFGRKAELPRQKGQTTASPLGNTAMEIKEQ